MISWLEHRGTAEIWELMDLLADVSRHVADHTGMVVSQGNDFNHVWPTAGECLDYLRLWNREIIRAVGMASGRPVSIDPSWLTSTVVALAEGIYAERAFDRLPILADAIEDAGCDHADILAHCRGGGPHARGCWAVDLLLGKE